MKNFRLPVSAKNSKRTLVRLPTLPVLPSALFVVDVMKEHIAVKEAQRLGFLYSESWILTQILTELIS